MAEKGDARAQFNLGGMYAKGLGVRQDYQEAAKWWRLAAAQGDADAQNNLGYLYENGKGVAQDYQEAAKWWRLAAAQGDARAQFNLGGMYAKGLGVRQDFREAVKWWRLAAANGNAQAQMSLGVAYHEGEGVAQDHREAAKWYQLAAAQGNAGAQNNLGVLYANGQGVTQDYGEAVKLWRLAAAQGNADALKSLSVFDKKEQAGLDLLARPAAGLLTDMAPVPNPPAAPETVPSQTAPDPFAPSQSASQRGSYLNRTVMGGIGGALIGGLAGLFILVRALVKKFKAPAVAGATEIYRDRPQAIKTGAALLLGCAVLLVYFLFIRTNTVDDYLNDYQGRLEKLQECGQVPDMTKDRECMNAYTAQRMFMLR
jgi:TPR repeat protein